MDSMNHEDLVDWSRRAVLELRDYLMAEREAGGAGSPMVQALVDEFADIEAGRETWQAKLAARPDSNEFAQCLCGTADLGGGSDGQNE